MNSKLFGGDDDIDLEGLVNSIASAGVNIGSSGNAITRIFGSGEFLSDLSENDLDTALQQGLDRMKLSLVSGLLRAQNFYVFINTQLGEGDCTATGSRFIDGQCAIISERINPVQGLWEGLPEDTKPVSEDILLKLDSPDAGYNVNVDELYRNLLDCNGGQLDSSLSYGASLPRCFWSLPVLKVDGAQVCDLLPGGSGAASAPGVPLALQITNEGCDGV